MVNAPVCGTGNSGSIPGSRPKIESAQNIEHFVKLYQGFCPVQAV